MKSKTKLILAGAAFILFILLILGVRTVDVAAVGPAGTSIGFSDLNKAVSDLTGMNTTWYEITDWLGKLSILTALLFALTGAVQLIRRRSLKKVDKEILILGSIYVILAVLYVLFEVIIINYRPVIMPGCTEPEASFPSSHTMLTCTIMGSTIMMLERYVKKPGLCKILQAVCGIVLLIMVIGRLLSGVHWLTDILGGVLISIALLFLLSAWKGNLYGKHSR